MRDAVIVDAVPYPNRAVSESAGAAVPGLRSDGGATREGSA